MYPQTLTLLGQPVEYWQGVAGVMRANGIADAKQLAERLSTSASPTRVDIYDSGNLERLLGSIKRPAFQGRLFRMAACQPCRAVDYSSSMVHSTIETADFEVEIKRGPNPLDVRGVLSTHTPLKTLLTIDGFRLPGETAEKASQRRAYW
jgi:hypothetical protein